MAQFENGIFGPTQTTGNLIDGANFGSDGLSFAANQIGKAMSLREGNAFDQTFGAPLRKRKRREIAKELAAEGLTPSDGEAYWSRFRDRLTEEGDMEGAEKVEMRRQQAINLDLDRKKTEAEIGNIDAQAEGRRAATELLPKEFEWKKEMDFENLQLAKDELDLKEKELREKIRSAKATEADAAELRKIQKAQNWIASEELKLSQQLAPFTMAEGAANTAETVEDTREQRIINDYNEARVRDGQSPVTSTSSNRKVTAPAKMTNAQLETMMVTLSPHYKRGGPLKGLGISKIESAEFTARWVNWRLSQIANGAAEPMSEGMLIREAIEMMRNDPTVVQDPDFYVGMNNAPDLEDETSALKSEADMLTGVQ